MKVNPFAHQFTRYLSAIHVGFYRLWGGAGPFDRNVCIVTTRGRKSGREIAKPLIHFKRDGKFYLVASYGGSDQPPAWYLNMVANPEVKVELGSERKTCRARTLSPAEKQEVWPNMVALWPGYADYQKRTTRDIAVVELSPIE